MLWSENVCLSVFGYKLYKFWLKVSILANFSSEYRAEVIALGVMTVSTMPMETCGQSYKSSTIVIYDSRVVPDLKIPKLRA